MIPNRHETAPPWWAQIPRHPMQPATFRREHKGLQWSGPMPVGDPRLTAEGDIARAGTIPDYVPMAVLNPGRYTSIPQ